MAANSKRVPFPRQHIEQITAEYPTPVYLYDEAGIRASLRRLMKAFSWAPEFREYFAVKANPNPYILKLLADWGAGADCSSMAELLLAERVGLTGARIMFTSNVTPPEEFVKARELGAIINLDDIAHLDYLERHAGLPDLVSFRWNPGRLRTGNSIIGNPVKAKFGATRAQILRAYRLATERGVRRFGLHTMVVSNELRTESFLRTAEMLFTLAVELSRQLGIHLELINLGGGFGIPYEPGQQPVDLAAVGSGIWHLYERILLASGHPPATLAMECGRYITGPHGYLVSRVRHLKKTYRHYAGLDATMANLMRPGMYGAYHHISVLGKERKPVHALYDVTGSLCENNDKFAERRLLPELSVGDLVILHDAGAHGHSMGFNYNGKLRCAEILVRPDGSHLLIRRAEKLDDYFRTIDFRGLASFGA